MKILVIKTNQGLKPCYDSDYEIYSKIQLGEQFEIEYKKKRNLKFHKKYFALLKLCFENQEIYRSIEELRLDLIVETGRFTEVTNFFTGEINKKANSMSFANMDELEFISLYEDTKRVICHHFKFNDIDIEENISQYF